MENEEVVIVSLRDIVTFLQRGLAISLLVGTLAGAAAYFLSKQIEPIYRARATLLASQPTNDARNFGVTLVTAPPVDVAAYRTAVLSSPVLTGALESLDISLREQETLDQFRERITVRTETTSVSSLVHIEVKGRIPAKTAEEAQAVAMALLTWDRERATRNLENIISSLESQTTAVEAQITEIRLANIEDTQERLDALQTLRAEYALQLNSARALRNAAVGRLEIIEPAQLPLEPVAPRPGLSAVLAFALGIVLAYGLLLLRNALDTRLKGSADLARMSSLPVLAEFPRQPGQRRLPREASGYLRTNLQFLTPSAHPKIILVTSANSAHGKSSVALSLSESLAMNDYRTLLIDADLRKPVLGKEYNLKANSQRTLRDHLEKLDEVFAPARVRIDNSTSLDIIPSFDPAPNPSELLSQGFQPFLQKHIEHYDAIVIDSAPILPVADTLTIAPHVTGIVFAVSLLDADRRSVSASLELLHRIGVKILGVVATNAERGHIRNSDAYGYGYGYGYGPKEDGETPKPGGANPYKQN